ncbi:MAG: hypothetical protein R3354_01470 [Thiohalomonadales bacterium]|nr:hypothetical protein [Thiohalomonadales bacterium]
MSFVKRPATMKDFVELVKSALFDVEELRMSVEFDMEFMEPALAFVDPLEKGLRDLLSSLQDGSHEFTDEDLPFMPFVEAQPNVMLPFKPVLRQINETHRKGLQDEAQD